jgi:alkyl hydroperoxide reductase subunit AhpF
MSEAPAGATVPRLLGGQALDETPDTIGATPRLTEAQISELAVHGERRQVASEEVLFREGAKCADFFVVVAGKVAIIDELAEGSTVRSRTVLLATGARYRRLDLPRMEEFESTSHRGHAFGSGPGSTP